MTKSLSQHEMTRLLRDWRDGDDGALARLMPLVYEHLKKIARHHMRNEGALTLQPTALVHEAYLRLADIQVQWQDRTHFFALSSSLMRRILVDEAKKRLTAKRGGGAETFLFMEEIDAPQKDLPATDLLALEQALARLGGLDARKVRVVELRFFAGLTIAECADVLGIGHATVERDLKLARAWLANQMKTEPSSHP